MKGEVEVSGRNMVLHWHNSDGARVNTMTTFGWIGHGDERKLVCTSCSWEKGLEDNCLPRSMLEELPIPVTILNSNLEVVFQNSAADEQLSLVTSRKDPVSHPKNDLKKLLMNALRKGTGGMVDVTVPMKDCNRSFDVIVTPIISGKDIDQIIEIWIDTSPIDGIGGGGPFPEKMAEELVENSNAVILGINIEGEIQLFNNGANKVLGYTSQEMIGTMWFDYLVDKEGEQGKMEVFQWNIGSGFRTQYESRVRSSSGAIRTLLLENTIIYDKEGEVSMVLMVGQDVTRTKKLEETLREQTEKLAEAMEELTLYNDIMIHDIHNANAGILGYLELLQMDNIPDEKKKQFIDRALSEVRKSSSIIKDVKLMSRSKPGLELEPVELGSAIKNSVDKFIEMGLRADTKITWDAIEFHVSADKMIEEALARVFVNLVLNSSKKDLKISVDVKRDHGKANLIPDPVHISIEDDGGSIPQGQLDSMLENPTSSEWGSHKLGLYLVKKIISGYNGLLWLESSKNGTIINIVLSEAV